MTVAHHRRQKILRLVLALLLPIACLTGARAYSEYTSFQAADAEFRAAETIMDREGTALARPHLERAVRLYPYYYPAWDAWSATYFMEGNYQRALEILEEASVHLPQEGRLLREAAQCHHKLGHYDQERECLEKATEAMPDDPLTQRMLERCPAGHGTGSPTPLPRS